MNIFKTIGIIMLSGLMALSVTGAASAARVYLPETNQWVEASDVPGSRASAIKRQTVTYDGPHRPGTIIIETSERRLYLVQEDGTALRYGVGVGRDGFRWSGTNRITRKAEWPGWTPPAAMRKRVPGLPAYMPGGLENPLGARALYIGSTLYRIHGTSEPWTIGEAVSSGCIRLTNEDVVDLYSRVRVGAKVVVNP